MRIRHRARNISVIAAVTACLFAGTGSARSQTAEEYEVLGAAAKARSDGDLALALRYLDALVEHSPRLPGAYHARAVTRRAAEDNAGARQDLDRAIELNPKWSGAYALRARWRLDEHDYAGAVEDAVAAGGSADAAELRGEARLALGRHAEALEDFAYLRSGRFGPYTNARYPFALCLLGIGRTAEAVEWFKTDYNDGGRIESRCALNLGYCLLGRFADAEQDLADWLAGPPPNDAEIPEYDRAQRQLLRENVDRGRYLLAVVRFAQQNFAGTVAALEEGRAAGALDDDAVLLLQLARLRSKSPEPDDAPARLSEEWPQTLADFLRGNVSEKELLAKAAESADANERRAQECQAAFYAGQKRLIAGDEMAASLLFEKAVRTGKVELAEYALAKIALR